MSQWLAPTSLGSIPKEKIIFTIGKYVVFLYASIADMSLDQQFLSKCKVHWHGSLASSELCTREFLVLEAGRNGGCKLTLDSGFGLEKPAYLVCSGSQKGFGCCQ